MTQRTLSPRMQEQQKQNRIDRLTDRARNIARHADRATTRAKALHIIKALQSARAQTVSGTYQRDLRRAELLWYMTNQYNDMEPRAICDDLKRNREIIDRARGMIARLDQQGNTARKSLVMGVMARAMFTIDNLNRMYNRFIRPRLFRLRDRESNLNARPTTATQQQAKAYKPTVTHREKFPAVDFSAFEYLPGRTAVLMATLSAERKRKVDPARNPYRDPMRRNDFIQIATLAYYEHSAQSALRAETLPDGRTIYNFNQLNPGNCTPLVYACRAIEREEYRLRGKRIVWKDVQRDGLTQREAVSATTPDEYIHNRTHAPTIPEHEIDRAFSAHDFKRDLLSAIHAEERLSAERRTSLIDIVTGKKPLSDRDKTYLIRIATNAGLIKRAVDGRLMIL